MESLQFIDSGGEHVRLDFDRWGTGHWKVMINNFNKATLYKEGHKWKGHLYGKSDLTSDDIDALGEIIERGSYDIASH